MIAGRPSADPTYRVSGLAAANKPPLSVKPDAPLAEAITLMLANRYSQVPVMTTEREVKGVVSWASVGSRLALGKNGVEDLTFGEYLALLANSDRWAKLNLAVDRHAFCVQLDRIREIRNAVMHFVPDGIANEDLERLRDFANFLDHLHGLGVS